MWNNAVSKYVHQLVERCTSCRANPPRQSNRKVSISSLSQGLNNVVCTDHFYLGSICLFHAMDHTSRYSAACVVSDASNEHAVASFQSCWVNQFWMLNSMRADKAFCFGKFEKFCQDQDIKEDPRPAKRHSKNVIESKHGLIRSVFLNPVSASPHAPKEQLALQALSISNDLNHLNIMSAFELVKGFTRPVDVNRVHAVPDEIINAELKLSERRKMSLILISKATFEEYIKVGDMV